MNMQTFFEETIGYVGSSVQLYAPVVIGKLSTNPRSIAFRLMPSAPGDRFFSGSRMRGIQFQVLTKSPDQLEAMNTLEAISDALESMDIEVTSEPNYLSSDEQGWTYTAAFRTEIIKE